MRWTLLAIAIAVGACGKDKSDQASHSDAAAAPADSAMPAETAPADTSHAAMSADTVSMKPAQTTTKAATKTTPAKSASGAAAPYGSASATATASTGITGAEAMMGKVAAGAPRQLSKDQIKQLQAALKKADCYKGTPDGVTGPSTQSAIECGLQKYKLTPNDMAGLYKKLGLKY
jgi:peptidoglycan hydrolase-like protein with peptidoglycan-binding domain